MRLISSSYSLGFIFYDCATLVLRSALCAFQCSGDTVAGAVISREANSIRLFFLRGQNKGILSVVFVSFWELGGT